ncbi:hypothetical protein HME9304_01282 [Flagellimonas maritima]|uniref:Fibronectin type-III domain-containing protein n=1 Tax=Flagellimonas maritima TaxID=1383885 RepID=A0A2Z4LR84_9FLAO|nr:deaminase domain-containing protein [Allomuricauda aurantiaca]AWX44282.1 hypothetical protein HME9304_01282 [Allomuricauda aurantiaca]
MANRIISFFQKNRVCIFFVLLFNSTLCNAQSFPVSIAVRNVGASPTQLSSYADAAQANGPLLAILALNDLNITGREVQLRMSFEGGGIDFQSVPNPIGAGPFFLDGGIPLALGAPELAPYFEIANVTGISPTVYGRPLPEGSYQICLEAFDVLTGKRLSARSCTNVFLFQNRPPFLVLPANGSQVDETNPQNIVFQWTPRQLNITNVEYELSLVEIWDGTIDPQAAFLSAPPLFQATTTATSYLYGPADPILLPDRAYAWRVRAKAVDGAEGVGPFENQGHSEIFSFVHISPCEVPPNLRHEVRGSAQANILWDDPTTTVPEFTVRYRQKGAGNAWFINRTTANWTTLWDLRAGTPYEYQLKKDCGLGESGWSTVREFTTAMETETGDLYRCGISPKIDIQNQEPLSNLSPGEQFVAGDFTVTTTQVNGGEGYYSGRGHVRIPYLGNVKLAVHFDNILLNTDRQLLQGTVVTEYDPTMRNILDTGDVVETVGELGGAIGDLWDELFGQKEELLNQLAEAESFEEQQNFISQINDLEVTIAQQIDQIPSRESLPQELQDELEGLKQEGSIVANNTLTPQEIADISTADAERRERIREIAEVAEDMGIFGDNLEHHVMAIINGYWCAKNNGEENFEYFYGRGLSFFDFRGKLSELGLGRVDIEFKTTGENHGKKEISIQHSIKSGKVLENVPEASYDGHCIVFSSLDILSGNTNEFRICFQAEEDLGKFEQEFLDSAPTEEDFYYTNLRQKIDQDISSGNYDDTHLLLTMLPRCEIENFSTAQRISLINSMLDDSTGTDGLQEQLIIRFLEEYGDAQTSAMAEVYRSIDLRRLFKRVDDEESDLLTYAISDYVGKYHSLNKKKYGGTADLFQLSAWDFGSRYVILKKGNGKYSLQLNTSGGGGQGASFSSSESIFTDTDIFSTFTITGENLEIPYILLLKGVLTQEDERSLQQLTVALDMTSLAFGVGELKLAFSASTKLARAFRIALASADISATAANVICQGAGQDSTLCEDWQKVGAWVQFGVVSASGADLLYQTLKKSPKLQDEVLRLEGVANASSEFLKGFVGVVRRGNGNELVEAANRISNHRIAINKPSSGNFGYVEGNINGKAVDNKLWSSGSADPITEPQIFDAIEVGGWIRNTDSEYKMLNKLADDLGGVKGSSYPNVTGEIKIVSERDYCASCQGVLQQFSEMFPNLKLILIDGVR